MPQPKKRHILKINDLKPALHRGPCCCACAHVIPNRHWSQINIAETSDQRFALPDAAATPVYNQTSTEIYTPRLNKKFSSLRKNPHSSVNTLTPFFQAYPAPKWVPVLYAHCCAIYYALIQSCASFFFALPFILSRHFVTNRRGRDELASCRRQFATKCLPPSTPNGRKKALIDRAEKCHFQSSLL